MEAIYSNWFIRQVAKGTAAFFSALIISALLFSSLGYIEYSQAESSNTQLQVNVEPILDLRVEKSGATITELDLSVTPTAAGAFVKDNLDVIVNTSNASGYTLTIADADTDTAMHNTVSTITDTIASLTTYASEQTFSNNTWGYSIEDIAQATQVFSPIPASTAPVAIKTTDTTATEDTTAVTFATKVDATLPVGTYQDTVVFSAVTNYVPPATSTFTVAPISTTNLSGGETFTLTTDIDWIDNIGQMLVTIYSTATDGSTCANPTAVKDSTSGTDKLSITCTSPAKTAGTYHVDLELLKFNKKFTATNTVEYVAPELTGLTNMQDMTTEICVNSAVGDEAILTDTRDGKTYVVRKLADNRCWMVQNLRLGGSSAITLTPADSNVTANFTLSATTNSFGTTDDATGIDINRMHDNGDTWLDGSTVNTTGTPLSQTQYMGNYYNWYTATAGSGTYSTNTSGTIVTQSICPKGWRLPNGGAINATTGNGEFQQLYDAYGNYNDFITATSAVLSGYWLDSSALDQGSNGNWWSRTVSTAIDGYLLGFRTSSVYPQSDGRKRRGNSVRCIAE